MKPKPILHSGYRTLEFLLWLKSNGLSQKFINCSDFDTLKVQFDSNKSITRNRYLEVETRSKSYIFKQSLYQFLGDDIKDNTDELKYEAIYYQNVQSTSLPSFLVFFSDFQIIVTEKIKAKSFKTLHETSPTKNENKNHLNAIGRALNELHRKSMRKVDLFKAGFPNKIPQLEKTDSDFTTLNIKNLGLFIYNTNVKDFYKDGVIDIIKYINKTWDNQFIIHFDLRCDNILIDIDNESTKIIDWEFASVGDPYWDLAVICGDLLFIKFPNLAVDFNNNIEKEIMDIIKCYCTSLLDGYFGNINLEDKKKLIWFIKGYFIEKYMASDEKTTISINKTIEYLLS
ncbi:MAG: aminoglycoside phosphotransferase family protein [Flavobacterium sp.]|jgi:serine/threonine protein kinase|nr:aminoglycoside phosphotransferase family protein [Flavobacterium sp.]